MKHARKGYDWGRVLRSCGVALAGLVALLALEYAAFRFRPQTLLAAVPFFGLYGLIVTGMVWGLAGPNPQSRKSRSAWSGKLVLVKSDVPEVWRNDAVQRN